MEKKNREKTTKKQNKSKSSKGRRHFKDFDRKCRNRNEEKEKLRPQEEPRGNPNTETSKTQKFPQKPVP